MSAKVSVVLPLKEKLSKENRFQIVGIGASAGGLDAFAQLLKSLDTNTGMAFVLIQHLDPHHESLLGEILARATAMPVVVVEDGRLIEPNHVYVIPPNTFMTVEENKLRLTQRGKNDDGLQPIDHFFRSLAHEKKSDAVGVVLSGTGRDGSDGIRAIQIAGGITIAQDHHSAKFDGMPLAAASSGADFILTPENIAKELARISTGSGDESNASEEALPRLSRMFELLAKSKNIDFSQYKCPTIQRRISRRMKMRQIDNIDDYVAYLKSNPNEIENLYEDILIKVTEFFRNPKSFKALKTDIFPRILKREPAPNSIRVWVPGCSTGEEVYSIAICLLETMDSEKLPVRIEIFGTDISEVALAVAREGYYSESRMANVSPERLERFFYREAQGYRISPAIREICIFAKQNVALDPPFSRIDLISCRNVLIYLNQRLQDRVITAFHFALNAGGFLALGDAERLGTIGELFNVTNKSANIYANIYAKKASFLKTGLPEFALDVLKEKTSPGHALKESCRGIATKPDLKTDVDQAILKQYSSPGVVISEQFDVVQFRGDTSAYLLHPPGEVTTNLFKMCRDGLMIDLRSALQAASVEMTAVNKITRIRNPNGASIVVFINVISFIASGNGQRYFVVTFSQNSENTSSATLLTADEVSEVKRLELELAQTKEYLNAIIEKEQASNEELKAASEEILSANEELQSTNEEMATAKEEVQATNEELITVNEEVQGRFLELNRVNNDLTNLFAGASIPILMVSENLCVRRFTQAAEKSLHLSDADIGKSLTEIESKIRLIGLGKLTANVIETLEIIEQEIKGGEDHWYNLRIKPYRTLENKIDGAVISLLDIDLLKRSLDRATEAHQYAEAIIETSPVPLLVLNSDLLVVTATDAFCQLFQIDLKASKNTYIYDLGLGQWKNPKLRHLLEDVLPKKQRIENFIIDDTFLGLGRRVLQLNARRLVQGKNKEARILLAINDVTNEKQSEEKTLTAKNIAEHANQSKSDFLANMSHEIRTPLSAIFGYSELLANPDQTKSDMNHCTNRIQKNIEQLMELIDEILDISKVEAGKLEVERIHCDLLPVLREIFILLEERASARKLEFNVVFEGDIPESILVCPIRLRQILLNIVGNALKFTEEGSISVTIKLVAKALDSGTGTSLNFKVRDTGCGLSSVQQKRLFQPFSQADSSITRKYGGSGLGLILARRLAQALGGDVTLDESSPGHGSTFTLSLDPGPLADIPMLKGVTESDLKGDANDQPSDVFSANQRLSDMRVLLVEDSTDIQILMTHILESSGATVASAINGAKAIKMAMHNKYDLVLMDMQMPILDGYEAMKQLRAKGYKTPVIALTANAMRGEREKCLAVGCIEYISKPVKANTLIDIVERFAKTL